MKLSKLSLGVALVCASSWTVTAAEGTDQTDNSLNESDIETIIVTGRSFENDVSYSFKTPELLVNVPQSLSIVSAEQIADQQLQDFGDVLRYTPGASIGQGEGHRDQITIRGQNTTADFFVDGVRDDVQYFRPLYNLERIEILRGSNALVFGRGGGGGVINRVTKTPFLGESANTLTGSLDSFGSGFVTIDSNIAIDENQSLRVNGFYEELDNHRDFFSGTRFAVNPTYLAKLNENTTVLLSYEYVDDDRDVDRGVPSLNGRPLTGFDDTFFGDPDFNRTTFEANVFKARIDHRLTSSWALNATVQYGDYDKLYQNLFPVGFDDVAGTVSLDGYIDTTERQNLIAQVNLVGQFETGAIRHTLLVGVEYGDQDTENDRRDTFFTDSQDDQITFVFSDPLSIPEVAFPTFNRDRQSDVNFESFYIQDQLDIGEHFKIIAGVRFDSFDIDVIDVVEVNNGIGDGNSGFLGREDEEVSPRLGVIYKPQEDISIYASYNKSFLPRSGDQFLTLSLTSQALAPEEFKNLEVGIKWDIVESLSFTASAFDLERENGVTIDPNNVDRTILIGTETRGVELQLVGNITDSWSLNLGYSNFDAEELGRIVDGESANRTLSQVPENMFSAWSRYDYSEKLGFGAGVTYQSSQFANIDNQVELPSYARFDMAVYYALNSTTDIQLNIENLFDREYFPAAHNNNNISTGEPVNARISISHSF
jgi:catecholate siderophore receptor